LIRVALLLLGLLCLVPGTAFGGSIDALGGAKSVRMHDPTAQTTLNSILTDANYWDDAWQKQYKDRSYDEIRFKDLDLGFVPMISGDGNMDISHKAASKVAFTGFDNLPKHLPLAKKVVYLGQGYDEAVGAEYTDTFLFVDIKFLYAAFTWRMYRQHDEATGFTTLWFELLPDNLLSPEKQASYQATIDDATAQVSRRSMFSQVASPKELYGMFVLQPGVEHETRVVFVARLTFGQEVGWVVRWGSQLQVVLRMALQQAFEAAVALCVDEMNAGQVTPDLP
jgi:hypothetical protein